MRFQRLNMRTCARREHYEHFLKTNVGSSAPVHIDSTTLRLVARQRGVRIYPAQIWMLVMVTRHVPEFRMSRGHAGRLDIWEELSPL